ALAVVAGTMLPVQAAINARLGTGLGGPVWAALASFAVGTVALAVFLAARRSSLPAAGAIAQVPTWGWVGGLLGAFYVATMAAAVPRLGGAMLIGLVIAGQIGAALLLDASGALPVQRGIGLQGAAGALLIVAGVILVARR
ncbi:MAG: DMT family transporter, partial [Janthinobacterium lividum]